MKRSTVRSALNTVLDRARAEGVVSDAYDGALIAAARRVARAIDECQPGDEGELVRLSRELRELMREMTIGTRYRGGKGDDAFSRLLQELTATDSGDAAEPGTGNPGAGGREDRG